MSKAVIKWLADNFYDSDLNRLNNHVNEIGTPGTTLYNLLYSKNANLRRFTGVKYLTDLPHKPVFYMSTRTGKNVKIFQLNELKKLVSYKLKSPSHFEKGSVVTQGIFKDGAGNLYYIPLSILGETMLIVNLHDSEHKFYFIRDHPENFFTHTLKDIKNTYTKMIYGDKGRYLGIYYGNDGMKFIYIEAAGILSTEYLTVKPFNMLALRSQFHMPTSVITPVSSGRKIPQHIRNNFVTHRDLKNIIPENHYVINDDGTITTDPDFYYPYGRHQIPSKCTVKDWYRDIMFEGNGHVIDKIIAAGGSRTKFDPMRMESSWNPVMSSDDAQALAEAQALCAALGIYGPFAHYKDFFHTLMTIDWAGIDGNYNEENYDQRLGLTEDQAKQLVQDHGFVWNTDPAAPLEYIGHNLPNNPIEAYWNDFEHMYEVDKDTPKKLRQWTEMAFLYMIQHMLTPGIGSGQVHLLFEIHAILDYWNSDDADHLLTDEHGHWLYPGDPSINLGEMSYFPDYILSNLITEGKFSVLDEHIKYIFYPFNLNELLNLIWERTHPE